MSPAAEGASLDGPLVTVIIPSYNHSKFVEAAIQSILDQTYPHVELIVVDDGSKDNSTQLIQRLHEKTGGNFTFYSKLNGGASSALNFGITRSSGQYVAITASDDRFLPEKIARQVALFDTLPDRVGIIHAGGFEEYDGAPLVSLAGRYEPAIGACFKDLVARRVTAIAPTVMFRRSVYDEVGGFDESLVGEDLDFYAAVSARGYEFAFDPTPLVVKTNTGAGLGGAVELYFRDPFVTLEKYADHFNEDEYQKIENQFYGGMARAAAGVGKLRIALRFSSEHARREHSIGPLIRFCGLAARYVTLSVLPSSLRHRLRMMRAAD
jgi:glycosyltransferase involved in cell wall biosynthesis